MQRVQAGLNLGRSHVSEEPQPSHVHAEDGYLLRPHAVGRLQERAVAAHRNGEVGREVVAGEHVGGRHVEQLALRQKVVVLAVDQQFCPEVGEAGQHFLDGSRLLGLVNIAEKGKL